MRIAMSIFVHYIIKDGGSSWIPLNLQTPTDTIPAGKSVQFKSNIPCSIYCGVGYFESSGKFNAAGNPMSLVLGDDFVGVTDWSSYIKPFAMLFRNARIVSAKNLRLTSGPLPTDCFGMHLNMGGYYEDSGTFIGCTYLTEAPTLPSTELSSNCYRNMFSGCTSLETAPDLPAVELVSGCYINMFKGCTSLNHIKAMFTTTPSATYTANWVNGVSASGTFVKNSASEWDVTGPSGIPSGWTVDTASS